ncbi:MAG: PHP domain-containing protein [Nostocoides sp.]
MIDLHAHSNASDGTLSPTGVLAAARDAGLTTIALTDHDTTAGWDEAVTASAAYGVALVRGIEISCSHRGTSIHLLGYLPDPTNTALADELEHARNSRATRLQRMVERMAAAGIPISYADVLGQVEGPDTTLGRPHIADALVAKGVVPNRDSAFADYLGDGSPYFVSHYAPDPVTAVRLVRRAGGVPVMAHPFASARGRVVADSVIASMAAAGLGGLEVEHRDHTAEQRAHGHDLAGELGLFTTGSSDFHGEGKMNRLGEHTTSPEVLAQIEAEAAGCIRVVRP